MGGRAITDGLTADTTPVDKSFGHFDGESVAFSLSLHLLA